MEVKYQHQFFPREFAEAAFANNKKQNRDVRNKTDQFKYLQTLKF